MTEPPLGPGWAPKKPPPEGDGEPAPKPKRFWWRFALASVLGLILTFYGTFEIIQGVASRAGNPYWWLNLITGILLVLLAFWVLGSDRVYALSQRTALILFWVGFFALFRGFSQIMLAFGVRHAGEAATALDAAGPG